MKILILNGPNLNMLGIREPEIYGTENYDALVAFCEESAKALGVEIEVFQSNHEGALVDKIQDAYKKFDGIVINPAAYTHTSIAILDAIKAVSIPTVEVHLSNPDERDEFRKISYIRKACVATVMGEGFKGYRKAMQILISCRI